MLPKNIHVYFLSFFAARTKAGWERVKRAVFKIPVDASILLVTLEHYKNHYIEPRVLVLREECLGGKTNLPMHSG